MGEDTPEHGSDTVLLFPKQNKNYETKESNFQKR